MQDSYPKKPPDARGWDMAVLTAILLGAVLAAALLGLSAWIAAGRLAASGDQPGDVRSTVQLGPGRTVLVRIANPGRQSVVIGWSILARRVGPLHEWLTPRLVIRPARWRERRRDDRGAAGLLGAVEPGGEQLWCLPAPGYPSRIRLVIGQAGGRLRVHEHALPRLPALAA